MPEVDAQKTGHNYDTLFQKNRKDIKKIVQEMKKKTIIKIRKI